MANINDLQTTLSTNARKLVSDGKGILAADESEQSIKSRFRLYDIDNTEENRRKFRQILLTSSNIKDKISGVILHEETFSQKADNGQLFVDILLENGIFPGIKLDKGLIDFKLTEKVSVGLEDLDYRLSDKMYEKAKFAKWRSVFSITETTPSEACIHENCSVLSKYALICQSKGIVPIVEPELLWDGKHSVEEAESITKAIISCLFYHLNLNDVYIPGLLLKPAFVTHAKDAKIKSRSETVAQRTYNALISAVPNAVPGVVFLSGGHTPEEATEYLRLINQIEGTKTFKLSFSYGRALSDPVLKAWSGNEKKLNEATAVFEKRVEETHKAALGKK